jgi:hypothetical protein
MTNFTTESSVHVSTNNLKFNFPAYFEALIEDFGYQLKVIGKHTLTIVCEKIKGKCFEIKRD